MKLKDLLQSLGLLSVPRTSGSSGLQVFVPIEPIYTFEQTRRITTFIANYFQEQMPKQVTSERVVTYDMVHRDVSITKEKATFAAI
ncbi:hypothetical protein [Lederbergia citrea]|uniref:DNA ligase D polymerase domain-containing protein n=2 Tax=Lederbergia citrea TaxID=2833581 RepID=A0A942Z6A8_9BACI|nr:hypothetical protein [Lederbergia citrea]MBS4223816.1 hypothetical protein [Lederbergia citrea]